MCSSGVCIWGTRPRLTSRSVAAGAPAQARASRPWSSPRDWSSNVTAFCRHATAARNALCEHLENRSQRQRPVWVAMTRRKGHVEATTAPGGPLCEALQRV